MNGDEKSISRTHRMKERKKELAFLRVRVVVRAGEWGEIWAIHFGRRPLAPCAALQEWKKKETDHTFSPVIETITAAAANADPWQSQLVLASPITLRSAFVVSCSLPVHIFLLADRAESNYWWGLMIVSIRASGNWPRFLFQLLLYRFFLLNDS